MSILYIVSTPIGNLGDVTHRALDVLREADRVLAEDTRRTAVLLRHYGIETPLVSAHEHNEAARAGQVVDWLDAGETLALVSDAGTPILSDPGERIVRRVLDAGHTVVPVPGASALLAALVGSGLPAVPFTFYGFVPRARGERDALFQELATLPHTAVLYESPARLQRLLLDLKTHCGGERPVVVARELTKLHETFVRGTLAEAVAYYEESGEPKGEVVVVLGGATRAEASPEDVAKLARRLLEAGGRPSAVAREVAQRTGLSRNDAYAITLAQAAEQEEGTE
ncbi:MAG: 16S rRNA (cytidine(1402)-2'-O)-methyltransferase [Candidatus Cloacimonetes bacterium]|nr:16S rRNA (cytidine(1402)-2'-O)-methyltransferase [Candidatus Cloacimonadota bacterium]